MLRTGILGYPLNYTLSPILHQEMFYLSGIKGVYEKYAIPPEKLNDFISFVREGHISGINVTIPYKETVFDYLDFFGDFALKTGAVNTVKVKEGKLKGYNTDVYGFDKSLAYYKLDLRDKRIAVLGTGGVAKACAYVIKGKKPKEFFIISRDKRKAENFSRVFSSTPVHIDKMELIVSSLDILVNATPVSFRNYTKSMKKGSVYYELKYDEGEWQGEDIKIINGLIMLIYQAIKAFQIWTGKELDENLLIRRIKNA